MTLANQLFQSVIGKNFGEFTIMASGKCTATLQFGWWRMIPYNVCFAKVFNCQNSVLYGILHIETKYSIIGQSHMYKL